MDNSLTPEDIAELQKQGIDPSWVQSVSAPQMGAGRAAISTLKAHAGGLLGGGAGALGAGALLAPWLAGPEVGLPADLLMLGGVGLGAAGGAALGQKAQEAIEPSATYNAQQEAAAQAQQEHPYVSLGTDIAAGALTSGGSLSPSTLLKAGRGIGRAIIGTGLSDIDKTAMAQVGTEALSPEGRDILASEAAERAALKNVGIQSTINPALNAGISYATTGNLPSGRDTIASALGGALFAKPSFLGRMAYGQGQATEPESEPTSSGIPKFRAFPTEGLGAEYQRPLDVGTPEQQEQRRLDFLKAKEEMSKQETEQAQPYGDNEGPNKPTGETTTSQTEKEPLSADALRMATTGILPSAVARPEVRPKLSASDISKDYGEVKREQAESAAAMLQPQAQYSQQAGRISLNYKPEDFQQYLALQKSFTEMTKAGQYQTPEFQQVFKNLETLKNKYNGMPPRQLEGEPSPMGWSHEQTPSDVVDHIFTGKATTGSVMAMMAAHQDHPFAPLAKTLYENMDAASRAVPWDASMKQRSAYYPPQEKTIPTPDTVSMALLQSHAAPIVMEEAVHSMTSAKLPVEWSGLRGAELHKAMTDYLSKKDGNESVKELIKSYIQTAQHLGIHNNLFSANKFNIREQSISNPDKMISKYGVAGEPDEATEAGLPYAMGDLHEFIAHAMVDKDFQHKLNALPSGLKDGRTMWQRLVDAISKLLGLPVNQNSMLDRVLRNSAELVRQERPKEGAPNAIQEPSTRGIFSRPQEGTGEAGSERRGMGQSNEGKETTKEGLREERTRNLRPEQAAHGDEVKLKTISLGKVGQITKSLIDKVREIKNPTAETLSKAFHNVYNDRQQLTGQWVNKPLATIEKLKLTAADKVQLGKQMEANRMSKRWSTELLTNSKQRQAYDALLAANKAILARRIEDEEPVIRNGQPTMSRQLQGYWPTMAEYKTGQQMRSGEETPELQNKHEEYVKYAIQQGKTPEHAEENWKDLVTATRGNTRSVEIGNQQYFNASRRSHDIYLPPSMRENDPLVNWERYARRSAMDSAYYKNVESNHEAMAALGETKDPWLRPVEPSGHPTLGSNPAVQDVLQNIRGEIGKPAEYNESAISQAATTTFIAWPGLQAHIIISNLMGGLAADSANPYQYVKVLAHSLNNLRAGYQHAVEGGLHKMTARSAMDMFTGTATASQRLQGLARAVRNVASLNDLTNKFNVGILQAAQEVIVPSKINKANAGDYNAQQWIRSIDPNYKVGKTYTTEEIQKLASIAGAYIHGTGDARNLPGWMLNDSEFSGFFALAHWSTAQTNRFYSRLLTPALKGDIGPLMTSLFGAAIGGYMVKLIREKLQGKHNPIPSLAEIAASDRGLEGNMGLVGYNLVAAMQYSGFGGLLAQVAKYPFDAAYKNQPYGAAFPLDEITSDLASTVHEISEAAINDPHFNWLHAAEALSAHIFTQSFIMGRMAMNQAIDHNMISGMPAEKKQLADKLGQLRRFDMAEGLPYNDIDEGTNPYLNLEQKRFHLTQDLGQAMKQLPEMVNTIVQTYGQNPDVMLSKLKALKENQYSTFPSLDTMPLSFMKYLGYLERTEGSEAAQSELTDYMKHRLTNQVKSVMVP